MFEPDIIQKRALESWYDESHKLYGNPLPALMGIVGESGELCDIWKKKLFKPGYEFQWETFLDELGDCLFYVSILCLYADVNITKVTASGESTSILAEIAWLNETASSELVLSVDDPFLSISAVEWMAQSIIHILDLINLVTLDKLSQMNYAKLMAREINGTGYNRGVGK